MRMILRAFPVNISQCILYSDGKCTIVKYSSVGSVSMEDGEFRDYDGLLKCTNSALLDFL